jgi:hypothetical protein
MQTGVGVEKVHFPQNSQNLGDGKCLGKSRKSFVGLPIAKFFRAFSGDGVFQQPQAITLFDLIPHASQERTAHRTRDNGPAESRCGESCPAQSSIRTSGRQC